MKKNQALLSPSKSVVCLTFFFLVSFIAFSQGVIKGEKNTDNSFKKWHRIEIEFNGPQANESKATFFNYRMDVTFTSPTNKKYIVPGFYDADSDPANSGATSGNIWKVRFCAGEEGSWTYNVSFFTGVNVATQLTGGTKGTAPDGFTGSFKVGKQDKSGLDFRAKGKLEYVGEHYLKFANDEFFTKVGAGSPEVFLGDTDFDGSSAINSTGNVDHSAQIPDWKTGDPTWGNGKGKGIIGVINYLAGVGINSHYFLSMNIEGDGKRAFPFIDYQSPYIYDVSKLGQWEIVFTHFDTKGLMIHFVTQEIENAQYFEDLEGGSNVKEFSDARKVYYRELIARFGHHMAITWNVGEENNATFSNGNDPNTTNQRKLFAERLRALTYYKDNIVVHNGGSGQDRALDIYTPLLGNIHYTGTSLQLPFGNIKTHDYIKYWWNASDKTTQKWVINYDEPFGGSEVTNIDVLRKGVLWPTLSAGGSMEWYLGPQDLSKTLNYRTLDAQYKVLGYAATFMNKNLSKHINRMSPNDDLISNKTNNFALAEQGQIYLFYLKSATVESVDLSAAKGKNFELLWFDPKTGISTNAKDIVAGTEFVSLGLPPSSISSDCVALLKIKDGLGVSENNTLNERSIAIYPNPTQNSFYINGISADEIKSLKLYDMNGKSCKMSTSVKDHTLSVNIENLSVGNYLIQIKTIKKTITKKIVKQ